ncbi:MAG: glycoside hydrolase family protein [Muribaculaceae bacterium]|nr:glycoside hydrolase family protein [Muribaculaceae bacterium]
MRLRTMTAAALIAAAVCGIHAKSPKRGVSENEFQFKAQMAAIAPGVSWYYNWGPSVGRYLKNETMMEFVPMCWNGDYDADAIRTYVGEHSEVRYLLGFNEPNFTKQANMTPQAAAARWEGVRALASELGLGLVAPALNYSPNPPYQDPVKWMDEFVAIVGPDAFDYTAIHSYGGFGVMKELAETFHERYGKPVWVTEFCYWPEEGNPDSTVQPEAQTSVMMQSVEWLEKTDWIFRYAWFKAVGESSAVKGPNFGLLISGHGEDPRELSEQGMVYEHMWDFDADKYFPTEEWIPASHYISQYGALLGSSADGGAVSEPIEIVRFNGGAWADYQFDVPRTGEYVLELSVSGQGEPVRFDPCMEILASEDDAEAGAVLAEARTFALSGSAGTYGTVGFTMNLTGGRRILRVSDAGPGKPSGIRIEALRLCDAASVGLTGGECDVPTDVYNAGGMLIRRGVPADRAFDGLPAGLYVAGGRKIIIN